MKKLTMQLLAESLQLSRVTVWKVLNGKDGVASETAERVKAAVELLKEEQNTDESPPEILKPPVVTVILRRAETSMFWMSILEQIAVELKKNKIRLDYLPYELLDSISPERTNGLVVANLYDEDVLREIAKIPLPKVFYDTPPTLTTEDLKGDLLLIDGKNAVERLTCDLISKGSLRLGFVGDIGYARTNELRWEGFKAACGGHGLEILPELCLTKISEDYPQSVSEFLASISELPDAFVCASDHLACLLFNMLHGKRCNIPNDLKLTGFDDSKEFMLEYHNIPTVRVQKGILGRRLINQLIYRMQNQDADYEEIFIKPQIVYR